jgi:hypothetical protein
MGAELAHQALHVLHGPLSSFVDYTAMVALGTQDYRFPDALPFDTIEFMTAPDEELGPTASPTSLDYSLPTSTVRSTAVNEEPPANETTSVTIDAAWEGIEVEILHQGPVSNKRKNPDGEDGGLFQKGRRKKLRKFPGDRLRKSIIKREALKAAGFTDATAVRMMAGVRLGSVETAHRIEDMVGHRYGVNEASRPGRQDVDVLSYTNVPFPTQRSFPVRLIPHPFLFDLEVAKIQTLWHILQRNGRQHLAGVLYDILSVRLRKDYAVSHLFSAGYLEDNFPELECNYWELLRDTTPAREPSPFTATFGNSNAGPSQDSAAVDTGVGNASHDSMSLGYPPSDGGGEDRHHTPMDREGKFRDPRGSRHHVHCPDFVPHRPDVA